jgi:protein involved in polysaccharide export with SLBB domain
MTSIAGYMLRLSVLAMSLLCLGGLALSEVPDNNYKISAGDMLEIRVYQEEDLGGEFTVNEDGAIAYPLLGLIKVANLTRTQAEKNITELLEKDYLVRAYVHVSVRSGRR